MLYMMLMWELHHAIGAKDVALEFQLEEQVLETKT